MHWTQALVRRLAWLACGLMLVAGSVSLVSVASDPSVKVAEDPAPRAKAPAIAPFFTKVEPAENPSTIVLMQDVTGITGWVSGSRSFAGQKVVVVNNEGDLEGETLTISGDNTFRWNRNGSAAEWVVFSIPGMGKEKLRARATLDPLVKTEPRSAFFITDRSAYRPNDTIRFAAFLRSMSPAGEFKPIENAEVVVSLTSELKKMAVARVTLRSDAFGRIAGALPFSDSDPLDHYTLSIPGYSGSTRVVLAEYRKSEVSLKLTGEVKGEKLALRFEARDYLGRPVRGQKASYTALVTRTNALPKSTLDPAKFAHPNLCKPPSVDDLDALPLDEKLLATAYGFSSTTLYSFGKHEVARREGAVEMQADGTGKTDIPLNADWLAGRHSVTVAGVLVDAQGRENRTSETFDVTPHSARSVTISVPHNLVAVGDKIPVSVGYAGMTAADRPVTFLAVQRIESGALMQLREDELGNDPEEDNVRMPAIRTVQGIMRSQITMDRNMSSENLVRKSLVTVLPVPERHVQLENLQPGAYQIAAFTQLADGSRLRSETGVVVKPAKKLPSIVLHLASREIDSGTLLRGVVHSRFANAKMLLSIRDAGGIRFTKVLTANPSGVAAFAEELPPNLCYGCAVSVRYVESRQVVHADQRELLVVPVDRTIGVTTNVPESVKPGSEVPLTITIDRKEEVDLVVSVYDETLRRVADDLAPDIRGFYLADTRGQTTAARELAATRLGQIPVSRLIAKADRLVKKMETDNGVNEPFALRRVLRELIERWQKGALRPLDVVTLVRLAGYEVYMSYSSVETELVRSTPALETQAVRPSAVLADLFADTRSPAEQKRGIRTAATVVNGVVILSTTYLDEAPFQPWANFRDQPPHRRGYYRGFADPLWDRPLQQLGGFGGDLGLRGGINNLGNGGGIGGFGGGGFGGGGFGGGIGGIGGGNLGMFGNLGIGGMPGQAPVGLGGSIGLLQPAIGEDLTRRDFADTAFWSATARTDATGKATVTVKVPDSLTKWQVVVTAISRNMHVGSGQAQFVSTKPVMIWPGLPRAVTAGDTVRLFATVHNLTEQEQKFHVGLKVKNGMVLSPVAQEITVAAKANGPVYWTYRAGAIGETEIVMSVSGEAGSDAALKKLAVTRPGVEETIAVAGAVGGGNLSITLPDGFNPAAASLGITVVPSLLADMADTLPFLVDYPYGCVEQTMSRFLPAIRVGQILKQTGIPAAPGLAEKLPKVSDAGIKRLLNLQHADGGWGWHGTSESSPMMTSYALYGLIEAEKAGYSVADETALPRGIEMLETYLKQFESKWWKTLKDPAESDGIRNEALYCLEVYSRTKPVNDVWFERLDKSVGDGRISDYGHALALEIAVRNGKKPLAAKLADELHKRAQVGNGKASWRTAQFTRWQDNTVEITAVVLNALVANDSKDPLIPQAMTYLQGEKRGDHWHSTKDTACVLYAFAAVYQAVQAGKTSRGGVDFVVDGQPAVSVNLDGAAARSVSLAAKGFHAGKNTIVVRGADGSDGAMIRAVVRFTRGGDVDIPARANGLKVTRHLSVRGKDGQWKELADGAAVPKGSYVRVRVTASSTDGGAFPYTLVESPKPACGETVPEDDKRFTAVLSERTFVYREDRDAMTCFHYEDATGPVVSDFIYLTEFTGDFRLAPARVEQMYKPDTRGHSSSFRMKVVEAE